MAFKAVSAHLRGPDDYELIAYRLMQRLKEEMLHAEVYVSVGVCLFRKQDFAAIFEGLERGRARGARDFGVSLLGSSTLRATSESRKRGKFLSWRRIIATAMSSAIGIGGDELKLRLSFSAAYTYAAEPGLAPDGARRRDWSSGIDLGSTEPARRAHWPRLYGRPGSDLIEELAQRQIPVELCITSNLRTGVCKAVADHPRNYFDQGFMITLNTDDPALFGTTLSREYQLAQETFGFTDEHLRELARNSFEASFLPAEKKLELLSLFDAAAARNCLRK